MDQERTAQIRGLFQKYKNVIVIISILLFSVLYFEVRFTMEREEAWVQYRYLETKIKVSYKDNSTNFINLIAVKSEIEINDLTGEQQLFYTFVNSNLGIVANFSKVEIWFYIGIDLYLEFEQIRGRFFIEDKTGVIRRYDFGKSQDGMPYYIAKRDISNLMFKEAVPEEINADVLFTN